MMKTEKAMDIYVTFSNVVMYATVAVLLYKLSTTHSLSHNETAMLGAHFCVIFTKLLLNHLLRDKESEEVVHAFLDKIEDRIDYSNPNPATRLVIMSCLLVLMLVSLASMFTLTFMSAHYLVLTVSALF